MTILKVVGYILNLMFWEFFLFLLLILVCLNSNLKLVNNENAFLVISESFIS